MSIEKVRSISAKMTRFTTAVGWVSFVCVLIMMLMNVVDVISTKLFQQPVIGAYELTQRFLMCAVFASFAYGQSKKSHINMTLVIAKFPRTVRFIIFTLMGVLSTAAAGAMTWAAFLQGNVALETGYMTEVLYIPLYPFYYIEFVAMAIFTVTLAYDTVLSAVAIGRDDFAEMIQADWS